MPRRRPESLRSSELPEHLRPLFWDQDFDALSWSTHRSFIVSRILTSGPWEAVQWVRGRLGDEALSEWIQERQGKPLSPKQLRFWGLILGLSQERIEEWLAQEARDLWDTRDSR